MPTEPLAFDAALVTHELQGIASDAPVIVAESKAGYKTTEFWASIVAVLVPLLAGLPEKFIVPLLAIIAGAYSISRGLAKAGVPVVAPPK